MDDIILNKVSIIERCILRVKEEFGDNEIQFRQDYTRQDAAILNIQRACEAALDLGQHIIRSQKFEVPKEAREVYSILAKHQIISAELADALQKMVGFRNIAVHEYQDLSLDITIEVIQSHLDDLLIFSKLLLKWPRA